MEGLVIGQVCYHWMHLFVFCFSA